MPKYYDISGKMSRNYLKKFYKGKKGKAFRADVQKLVMERQPFTGAEAFAQQQLGEGGFWNQLQPIAQQMQSNIDMAQPLLQRAAAGNLYDIGPVREAAERQFARTTGPGYFESRFAGGPHSSGFAEGFGQQARDMTMDLAALESQLNAGAQQQLALGGGLGNFLQAQQTPFAFLGQGLENLLGLGAGTRTSFESTRPGAAPLTPTFLEGPFSTLSNIEQNSRIKGEQQQYSQGGQAGGWFF